MGLTTATETICQEAKEEKIMEAVLSKLFAELNTGVFVLLVILGAVGWMLVNVGKYSERFLQHEKKIDKVQNLAERVIELKTKVDLIYQNTNPHRTVEARSPISLTPTGMEIAAKLNANVILQRYIEKLTREVELENPKNAYDIQLAAMKVAKEKMLSCLKEDELTAIKNEAYARGLLAEDIMSVFGVMLRDHILNLKHLPIADVDKHANQTQP